MRLEPTLRALKVPFDSNMVCALHCLRSGRGLRALLLMPRPLQAREIMAERAGVANRLVYQLYAVLGKQPPASLPLAEPRKVQSKRAEGARCSQHLSQGTARNAQKTHFEAQLKRQTPRQADLSFQQLEEQFRARQQQQEESALRAHRAEEQRALEVRKQKHKETLDRSREIKRQYDERLRQWTANAPPTAATHKSQVRDFVCVFVC